MVRVSGAGPVLATGCRELTSHAAYLLKVEVGVTAPTSRRPDLSRSSECCHASGHMMLDGVTLYMVRPLILLRLPTPQDEVASSSQTEPAAPPSVH